MQKNKVGEESGTWKKGYNFKEDDEAKTHGAQGDERRSGSGSRAFCIDVKVKHRQELL